MPTSSHCEKMRFKICITKLTKMQCGRNLNASIFIKISRHNKTTWGLRGIDLNNYAGIRFELASNQDTDLSAYKKVRIETEGTEVWIRQNEIY